MLFTKVSEYAILAMVYIAEKNTILDVDTVHKDLKISKSFLAKILQNLAKADILNSQKGAQGGFALSKDPAQITLNEIVKGAEKRQISVFECSTKNTACKKALNNSCKISYIFKDLQDKVDNYLDNIKLSDIISQKEDI